VAIRLQGESAHIDRFEAKAGAGSVRLEGNASLGSAPKAQLRLVADHFQLLGRVDRRIVASGTAQLAMDAQTLALNGRLGVDEGLVDFSRGDAPGLSDDVVVTGRRGPEVKAPAAAGRAREVKLDLQVELGERLRLRGRGLDTGLRGELRLTAPAGRLAVNGSVRAVDGTYAAYGQKLDIDRGVLAFSGLAENPRLDIEATRPNLDVRVGVAVTGTALNPRVRLFSEPEMSDTDKLSWLVLGRAPDGLGRTDTALLQRAALALLAGEGESVTDPVTKALGLDDVSVRQTDGEVRETVVSLGKQLSRRWYVGYERGLNATAGTWQLIYRIAQRFTLRAQSGLDNSLDVIWTWRWK
jgi:translocation and assembly module TamB